MTKKRRRLRSPRSPIKSPPPATRDIYCCGCGKNVPARRTTGKEIYPHREDLSQLTFWKCDTCGNYVGCHRGGPPHHAPLGVIPTPELRNARKHIHALLDPIWQSGKMERSAIYRRISEAVGWTYHTAKIRSIEEAREVYKIILKYARQRSRH